MGIPSGAHTHGSSGGIGGLLALLVLVVVGTMVAPAVIAIVHMLIIIMYVIGGVAVVAAAGFIGYKLNSLRQRSDYGKTTYQPRAVVQQGTAKRALPQGDTKAIENHIHFHGVSAQDMAEILQSYGESRL